MSPGLKNFLQRWLINTVGVLVATNLVPGIHYDTLVGLLIATLLLGVFNSFLRPFLMLLSLPLLIFSLGLFTLVINAVLIYLVGQLVTPFHVDSFGAALVSALIISVVSLIANSLTGTGSHRVEFRWRRRRSKPDSGDDHGDGGGPIIDV